MFLKARRLLKKAAYQTKLFFKPQRNACVKTKHKAQSALEFLMSYGWAMLVLVVIAAVLWYAGIFNPEKFAEKSVYFDVLTGLDVKADTAGNLTVTVGNNLGRSITLNGVAYVDGVAKTVLPHNQSSFSLSPGAKTTIIIVNAFPSNHSMGERVRLENVFIEYADSKSGITYEAKGHLQAKVENATVITSPAITLFRWLNSTHFDAGTYTGMQSGQNWLTPLGTQGEWDSDVKDAQAAISWNTISWVPELNYGQGLAQEQGVTVALWHFDENGGCTAVDSSSFASNGAFQPCTVGWQTGKVNYSLSLSGSNAVNVSYANGVMDLVQNYSFAGWVWRSGDGNEDRVWARGQHWFKLFSGNSIRTLVAGVGEITTTGVVPQNAWTHVAMTVNRRKPGSTWLNTARVYMNGVEVGSLVDAPGTPISTSEPLYLGRAPPGQLGNNWVGYFDEFVFTNRTLNSTDIQRIYQQADNAVYLQVKTGNTNPIAGGYLGPNGQSNTYYRTTPATINASSGRYMQVYALLTTPNGAMKPRIYNITVQGSG